MTQKERRQIELERHYESLSKLAEICGVKNPNGKKLSSKLLYLETKAHKIAEDYSNGENDITSENIEAIIEPIRKEVIGLFNNNLHGFFIHYDPRGYALKIDNEVLKSEYGEVGLNKDWGEYGILAPEITGK